MPQSHAQAHGWDRLGDRVRDLLTYQTSLVSNLMEGEWVKFRRVGLRSGVREVGWSHKLQR